MKCCNTLSSASSCNSILFPGQHFHLKGSCGPPRLKFSHSSMSCVTFLVTKALQGRAVPLLLLQDGLGRCCKAKILAHAIFTTLREVKSSSAEHLPGGQRENHSGGQPRSHVSPQSSFDEDTTQFVSPSTPDSRNSSQVRARNEICS